LAATTHKCGKLAASARFVMRQAQYCMAKQPSKKCFHKIIELFAHHHKMWPSALARTFTTKSSRVPLVVFFAE
jgi:hypothetical protein